MSSKRQTKLNQTKIDFDSFIKVMVCFSFQVKYVKRSISRKRTYATNNDGCGNTKITVNTMLCKKLVYLVTFLFQPILTYVVCIRNWCCCMYRIPPLQFCSYFYLSFKLEFIVIKSGNKSSWKLSSETRTTIMWWWSWKRR